MVEWFKRLVKRTLPWTAMSLEAWTDDDYSPPTSAGVYVNDEVALTCSAVYRAVAIISQSLAGLPVEVVRLRGRSVDIVDHWIPPLFNLAFSKSEGAVLGRERVQNSALLDRAGYIEIVPNVGGTQAARLNVIHPDRISPHWMRGKSGEYERFFQLDHGSTHIPDSNILQIPGFGFDGLEGRSVVAQARETIGHTKGLERYGAGNFGPGTAPRGVLKTGKTIPADQKVLMRKSWKAIHTDPNDIAILDEDYTFEPININNDDRQFLQSRSFQVVEIARWFGIPPHMLAELKDANYATTEHLGTEFKTLTLQPWVNRWEQELTRKLLSEDEIAEGMRVCLDMDDLLRADYTTRMNGHRIAVTTGIKYINEVRAEEGLPPSDDPRASIPLIQLNIAGADGQLDPAGVPVPATNPKQGNADNYGAGDPVQRPGSATP